MTGYYHDKSIPLAVYHGVPKGWYAHEMVAEHARLGGQYAIAGPEATEPGAPSWQPERTAWLQYRKTLYRVADGVRAQDAACVELAICYIELRYIGSYSGFIRQLLSKRLKHAELSVQQQRRLHQHFSQLVLDGERCDEFSSYLKLWRCFITEQQKLELLRKLAAKGDSVVMWLSEKLQKSQLACK